MSRQIEIRVVAGPEKGMRFSIESGTYRVIGRAGDPGDSTLQLNSEGDRPLEPEVQAKVADIFSQRPSYGARTRYRTRGPDILLADDSVSRTHAMIFVEEDGISVADLMSTNGTEVNGAPINDIDILPGDVVKVGQTKLTIEED